VYSSYLIALAVAVAAPGLRVPSLLCRLSFGRSAVLVAAASCSLLVLTFALQQHVLYEVARELQPTAPVLYRIPIIFIPWAHPGGLTPPNASSFVELIAVVQTVLLGSLYIAARNQPPRRLYAVIAVAAVALAALALQSRLTLDADVYSYLGLALVKPSAYAPGQYRFSAPYDAINALWGQPILPSPYGPLWIAMSKVAIAFGHSLWGKLLAFRLIELGALALSTCALVAKRVPFAVVSIFAVNPMLYEQYVSSAHNDALAVAFVLLASLVSRRRLPGSIVLIVAAAAIKLPLAAIGGSRLPQNLRGHAEQWRP